MNIKGFMSVNHLKQVEPADYLGITEASASKMCKGISNPGEKNLTRILNNGKGWDTSMLESSSVNKYIEDVSNNNAQVGGAPDELTRLCTGNQLLRHQMEWMQRLLGDQLMQRRG